MKYKTLKTTEANLVGYDLSKNINHDIFSKNFFNASKQIINNCKRFLSSFFAPSEVICSEFSNKSKMNNNNYCSTDIVDLRLKASQRTFL